MNIIEQLMVDHAALRLHFSFIRRTDYDSIYELEEFVRSCHARIEDEIVFPKIRKSLTTPDDTKLSQDISRLEADHKLIDMIGDQIKVRTTQGDIEMLKKRALLYMSTVESHNSSEESLIFQLWHQDNREENREAAMRASKIIQEFGLNRYFRITGMSEKLLNTVG